jgi:hypothetical protein
MCSSSLPPFAAQVRALAALPDLLTYGPSHELAAMHCIANICRGVASQVRLLSSVLERRKEALRVQLGA